jgi:putative ABC transport system permease protein
LKKLYRYLDQVHLHFNFTSVIFLAVLMLIVTHLAGLYPGWLLSRFKPIHMFKPAVITVQRRRFSLRQILVVFQFFVAQVFIACTLVIAQQMDFLKNAPLGFDENAIITVDLRDALPQTRARFSSMLSNETGIDAISFSMISAISQGMWSSNYGVDGAEKTDQQVNLQFADDQFFNTHGMKLLAGQVYIPSDSGSGFVVNESFVHELGLEQPAQALGKYISVWNFNLPIVGVVADYHANGFANKIEPMLIVNFSPQYRSLNLKVRMEQAQEVIVQLEKIWKITYPEFTFQYEFLDDRVNSFYKDYDRNFSLAQIFAGIAIFIGCLGLFGLVLFMAERRTKEIGIRKVLGASVRHILAMFSKEFVRLILIAFALATPLAYYAMQRWLEKFAYSIEIDFPVFLWCLLVTLLLVLITVGYQSIRAALVNPVNSLRDE